MITRAKIDSWIRQVEATPILAPIIIRQITDRLLELDAANETLQAENLELGSGVRVKDYERRIAELEFQLDLVKRQLGSSEGQHLLEKASLLLFNDRGQVIRVEFDDASLPVIPLARIAGTPDLQSHSFGLVTAAFFDQLLLVFNTGRTLTLPVDQIPLSVGEINWTGAYQVDMRSLEELAWILPITKFHVFDCCIQVSRFGSARKIAIQYFKTFIANNNIGKGVKYNFDRILNLVLSNESQVVVLASKGGNFLAQPAGTFPVALDEIMRFKVNDYVVSAFTLNADQSLVAITQGGAVYVQNQAWLQPVKGGDRRMRQLLPEKKEDGESLAGAVAVRSQDWIIVYREDGSLSAYHPDVLSSRGGLLEPDHTAKVIALAVYTPPEPANNGA